MLNLKTDIPIREEINEAIASRTAQIRDLTMEVDFLVSLSMKETVFLKREEVAAKLRCSANSIPRNIPRVRVGGNTLFKESDIEEFLKSRTIKH